MFLSSIYNKKKIKSKKHCIINLFMMTTTAAINTNRKRKALSSLPSLNDDNDQYNNELDLLFNIKKSKIEEEKRQREQEAREQALNWEKFRTLSEDEQKFMIENEQHIKDRFFLENEFLDDINDQIYPKTDVQALFLKDKCPNNFDVSTGDVYTPEEYKNLIRFRLFPSDSKRHSILACESISNLYDQFRSSFEVGLNPNESYTNYPYDIYTTKDYILNNYCETKGCTEGQRNNFYLRRLRKEETENERLLREQAIQEIQNEQKPQFDTSNINDSPISIVPPSIFPSETKQYEYIPRSATIAQNQNNYEFGFNIGDYEHNNTHSHLPYFEDDDLERVLSRSITDQYDEYNV
jgi:hypothetical protein